jgi:hypothetical protein
MTPPGATVTGWLANLWGIRTALALEALVCLVGVLVGWRYLSRSVPVMSQRDTQTHA